MKLLKNIFYILSIFFYPISSQYPPHLLPSSEKNKFLPLQAPETYALVFIYSCYIWYGKTWVQILSSFILQLNHFYFEEIYPCRNYFPKQNNPKPKNCTKNKFQSIPMFFLIQRNRTETSMIKKTSQIN